MKLFKTLYNYLLICLFSSVFIISCGEKKSNIKFEEGKWKSGSLIERGNMSTDLVESKILIGKRKNEIVELLGIPKDRSKTNFTYLVDFGYSTPYYLDVLFDNKGMYVEKVTLKD